MEHLKKAKGSCEYNNEDEDKRTNILGDKNYQISFQKNIIFTLIKYDDYILLDNSRN